MKKFLAFALMAMISFGLLTGCGQSSAAENDNGAALADGVYEATFTTDSNMFHVNETCDGKGTLTVKDGKMTIHVTLVSKSIVNLFVGTAEDAQKDGAELLEPTVDTVTYSDGYTEEVYGFDIPVKALDEEFDLALIGKKDNWYDHKVSVSNPMPLDAPAEEIETETVALEDGTYSVDVSMEGGTGKASIQSPCKLTVLDGKLTATVVWSSDNYDYMLVDDNRIEPITVEGGSTFEIPVEALDTPITVIGDTTAMSTPHEIEYTLTFDSTSAKAE